MRGKGNRRVRQKPLKQPKRAASYTPGPTGFLILREVAASGGWIECPAGQAKYMTCLKLHDRGLLDRDPHSSRRFKASVKGIEFISSFDAARR